MTAWPVQNAKARFSELLNACLSEGAQVVTRRGTETAVLVPIDEWKRLNHLVQPSLKALLLSNTGRGTLPAVKRGQGRRRMPAA